MKKIILLILLLSVSYYFLSGNSNDKNIAELGHLKETSRVTVTGVVKSNFKILGNGFYELKDKNSDESIFVISQNKLPEVGDVVRKKLIKGDLMTLNDKTFSVYEETK